MCEFVLRLKCERCLKEEEVDFGSDLHFWWYCYSSSFRFELQFGWVAFSLNLV